MQCRSGCAACCIEPSIKQAFANMPEGKAAGKPCSNLDPATLQCTIWEQENYPRFCRKFQPEPDICGSNRDEAIQNIRFLENLTM